MHIRGSVRLSHMSAASPAGEALGSSGMATANRDGASVPWCRGDESGALST